MIEASCHCGKVKINLPNSTETVTSCNCSVCGRFGALWAHFEPKQVSVSCHKDNLGAYCWGDKTIEFHHCKSCGCVTHYTPTKNANKERMAVNFRLAPTDILNSVKVRYFDGADTWQFIDK
ncbi:GFA family protein [Thalassomonas haliotis]|uniref:Aldehyde-activating protein n=1 Tax=Thalassomonas haliotis TaxID=485448 RepID=A0ABY7VJ41_9GAMM|nr:aldehyde-activating protein [Thalassomonas haliotis]WDE12985.1 aldehyde-activating protein [Thalassomonas haliotis]